MNNPANKLATAWARKIIARLRAPRLFFNRSAATWPATSKMNADENIATQLAASTEATQVVSRKTAAKLLDCHPSFVDTLCNRGDLETIRLGTHCKRIPLSSISRFLARAADA